MKTQLTKQTRTTASAIGLGIAIKTLIPGAVIDIDSAEISAIHTTDDKTAIGIAKMFGILQRIEEIKADDKVIHVIGRKEHDGVRALALATWIPQTSKLPKEETGYTASIIMVVVEDADALQADLLTDLALTTKKMEANQN